MGRKKKFGQTVSGEDRTPTSHTRLRATTTGTNGASSTMEKYYNQRYRYFSKFDDGIMMDDEAYYSTTPEIIAVHIARRCAALRSENSAGGLVLFDPFCGVGGNTIQFALQDGIRQVIAVDIDPFKIAMARHNAHIYGCAQKISFITTDSMRLMVDSRERLRGLVDIVFLSPPWGGPKYLKKNYFHLEMMPDDGREIFRRAHAISPNVAYLLPRNIHPKDLNWIAEVSPNEHGEHLVESEANYLNGRTKTVTAYTGGLVQVKDQVHEKDEEVHIQNGDK